MTDQSGIEGFDVSCESAIKSAGYSNNKLFQNQGKGCSEGAHCKQLDVYSLQWF